MKSFCCGSTFCIATLLSGMALQAQAPSVIEPQVERRQGPPLWISAEAVADEEKVINLELVDDLGLSRSVENQRQALGSHALDEKYKIGNMPLISTIPEAECKSASTLMDDRGIGPSATFLDLANNSKSILRGKIRSINLGFAFGVPSSLLEVEISEVVKGISPKSILYIDYPVARFRIGPFYFCNAAKGFDPRPGDEVLLFDTTGPVDRDHTLYAPRLDQLFFQDHRGVLIAPPAFKSSSDLGKAGTLDAVIVRLRSLTDPS